MPKLIDYPRASLKACISLADAVNDLGGQCSAPMAADKLGRESKSGAFNALVASSTKFGLVTGKKGQLAVTQLYRDIKLAYDERECQKATQKAFLSPPLFLAIFTRFDGKTLPVSHFEKLLIREFEVPDNFASRLASYFLEGAKQCGLLGSGDVLSRATSGADEIISNGDGDSEGEAAGVEVAAATGNQPLPADSSQSARLPEHTHTQEETGKFSVRIKGPGMDSLIVVNEEEDLAIVKAMLKKVEKRLAIEEWDDSEN